MLPDASLMMMNFKEPTSRKFFTSSILNLIISLSNNDAVAILSFHFVFNAMQEWFHGEMMEWNRNLYQKLGRQRLLNQ
jgi:hypothetical protein